MGSLFGLYEGRSAESPRYPLTSDRLLSILGGHGTRAGVKVSEKSSLATSAVYRSVALISGVAAALPMNAERKGGHERVPGTILEDPNPELTPLEFWRLTYVHRILWGNSVNFRERNAMGETRELWPLDPSKTRVVKTRRTSANPSGKVFESEEYGRTLLPAEVLHIPNLSLDGTSGLSVIAQARQTIGLAQASEAYAAKLFGSGNMLSGLLTTDAKLNNDSAKRLKTRWREKHQGLENAHDIAVLDNGAKFQPLTMPNDDAQFLESRQFSIPEIARFFGVPPFLLMDTLKSTSWGTGLEQQALAWAMFDLHPQWLAPTEQRVTKHLLNDPAMGRTQGLEAAYDLDALRRTDSAARAAFYRVMREVGAFSANDIRDRESLGPIEGGDTYLQPVNLAPLGTNPNEPAPPAGEDEGDDDA